ncbi:hypothetical protein ERUR111494_08545 [Erysipelothrix urinaevulpis]|uniref:hypothetical protein n=1 Tax=Erysipelothrix urinaevulpis TaxID=2683717 RepID=UPI00135A57AF|nr:hypothetical protein [Erysipelothrix urinaevulpis]
MNNKKSSIFDLDPSLLSSILWIIAILVLFKGYNFIPLLISFLALKFEHQSELVRNHAGQLLIISFIAFIVGFVLRNITVLLMILISWLPGLNITVALLAQAISFILNLFILAYYAIGLIKALKNSFVSLPVIGSLGDKLSRSIHP